MKKMYVCGDSWMSPSVKTPGLHLSQIVAGVLNFELVPLAAGGMSNGGICIQIDTAIQNGADFVLINTTGPDRLVLPIKYHPGWEFSTADILYNDPKAVSSTVPFNGSSPSLISQSIRSMIDHTVLDDYPEKRKAVIEYFNELWSETWCTQQDRWCLYAMLHKLHLSGIPYLVVLDAINVASSCPFIEQSILNYSEFMVTVNNAKLLLHDFQDPGYHTLPEAQQYAADQILEHIRANPRIFSSLGPDRSASQP